MKNMKTNFIKLVALLMIFTSCNKQKSAEDFNIKPKDSTETGSSDDIKQKSTEDFNKKPTVSTESGGADALKLFQQKCYACHSIATKSHDDIIAPPMMAVKRRYSRQYDNKEDFVNAVVSYAIDPKAENALMMGAVNQFKAMPKQDFKKEDLKKIAAYIYDNEIETPEWFEDHFQQNHKNGLGTGKGRNK